MDIPIRRVSCQGNYSERKRGEVSLIVLHHTAGYWAGDLKVLRGLTERKVSCHWLVGRTPEQGIVSIVPQKYAAWHAGRAKWTNAAGKTVSYVNDISLGIEMSRPSNLPPYTDFQHEAVAQLCAAAIRRYPAISWNSIVGHHQVAMPRGRKTDPNPGFPWNTFQRRCFELRDVVRVKVAGELVAQGRLIRGETWGPVRAVAEAAGLKVHWKGGRPPTVDLA